MNKVETQTGNKVKLLRTDNGKEFLNEILEHFLHEKGIEHERTAAHTPQMNGLVERDNRTVMERVKCMSFTADLSLSLWAELANTAVYLMNRTPNREETKTPFQMWHGHKPDVRHLRIIGSETHVQIPKTLRRKLDAVSWQGVLVGYGKSKHLYRVFNPEKNDVAVVKDVKIFESKTAETVLLDPVSSVHKDVNHKKKPKAEKAESASDSSGPSDYDSDEEKAYEEKKKTAPFTNLRTRTHRPDYRDKASDEEEEEDDGSDLFHDMISDVSAHEDHDAVADDELAAGMDQFSFLSHYGDSVPLSLEQAKASPDAAKWQEAMKAELHSLSKHNTWSLVNLPAGRKTVQNRWVFTLKKDREGKVIRHKARLVAKGFTQREGVDFRETFSPVIRYESLRLLLAVAAQKSLKLSQFDVSTAFLHGKLQEEIFMTQPEGFDDGSGRICKLIKGFMDSVKVRVHGMSMLIQH